MADNNITISLSADNSTANYVNLYGPFLIKGISSIEFSLIDIAEQLDPILHISGDFGDGVLYEDMLNTNIDLSTLNAIQIMQTGKIRSVDQTFSHIYEKGEYSFVDHLTASFVVTYTSQRRGVHNVQLTHIKDSYYNTIKQIHVNSTQILPVSTNDIFAVASDARGNVFNWYLSRSAIPNVTAVPAVTATNFVLALHNMDNYVLAAQQGGTLVPYLSA